MGTADLLLIVLPEDVPDRLDRGRDLVPARVSAKCLDFCLDIGGTAAGGGVRGQGCPLAWCNEVSFHFGDGEVPSASPSGLTRETMPSFKSWLRFSAKMWLRNEIWEREATFWHMEWSFGRNQSTKNE